MNKIYFHLLDMLEQGKQVALATIIQTMGSTPQVPGASALFSLEGMIQGTVGGGPVEAAVQKKVRRALEQKESCVAEFNLEENSDSEEGAVCGGRVQVLVDGVPEKNRKVFQNLCHSLADKRGGILGTWIKDLPRGGVSVSRYWIQEGGKVSDEVNKLFSFFRVNRQKAFSRGKPVFYQGKRGTEQKQGRLFLEPVFPPARLIIVGTGHIGRAVAHLGALLNFEVTVIDDRPEYANKSNLPEADHIVVEDIGTAVRNCVITPDTYLVIATRGHQHDAVALRECIGSDAAYIGMIGSRKKVRFTRNKFLEQGWATEEQLDRVHAPIGLPIGSQTVEEIAVSIAAQLIEVRRQSNRAGEET